METHEDLVALEGQEEKMEKVLNRHMSECSELRILASLDERVRSRFSIVACVPMLPTSFPCC